MPTAEVMYEDSELRCGQSSSSSTRLLAPPSSSSPLKANFTLPELLPSGSGLRTILPSLCDLVVGHCSEIAQQRVQQGWVGRRVGLGSAPLCFGDLGQQRCGSDPPRGVKLRHVERLPELVVGRVRAAAAGCGVKA